MTKNLATHFNYFSENNAKRLKHACSRCTAYKSWFTFSRWRAQGKFVKQGEHGTKIPIYVEKYTPDKHGKVNKELVPVWVPVFCKCQIA